MKSPVRQALDAVAYDVAGDVTAADIESAVMLQVAPKNENGAAVGWWMYCGRYLLLCLWYCCCSVCLLQDDKDTKCNHFILKDIGTRLRVAQADIVHRVFSGDSLLHASIEPVAMGTAARKS